MSRVPTTERALADAPPQCRETQGTSEHGPTSANDGSPRGAQTAVGRAASLDARLDDDAIRCVADALVNAPPLGPFGVVHLSRCSKRLRSLLAAKCDAAKEAERNAWVCEHTFVVGPLGKHSDRSSTDMLLVARDAMGFAYMLRLRVIALPPDPCMWVEVVSRPSEWRFTHRLTTSCIRAELRHSDPSQSLTHEGGALYNPRTRPSYKMFMLKADNSFFVDGKLSVKVSVRTQMVAARTSTFEMLRTWYLSTKR